MTDDATGRPKPTARRRRKPRSTASGEGQRRASRASQPNREPRAAIDRCRPSSPGLSRLLNTPSSTSGRCPIRAMATMPSARSFARPTTRDALGDPIELPAAANRCAAQAEAVPQSLRQQELVCLTAAHATCPRFLRGATVETQRPVEQTATTSKLTPATIGALALLVAAFGASVLFTFARGGLELPVAGAEPVGQRGRGRSLDRAIGRAQCRDLA